MWWTLMWQVSIFRRTSCTILSSRFNTLSESDLWCTATERRHTLSIYCRRCSQNTPLLHFHLCTAGEPVGGVPRVRCQTTGDTAAVWWRPAGHEGKGDPGFCHGQVIHPGPGCQRGGGPKGLSGGWGCLFNVCCVNVMWSDSRDKWW